MTRRSLLSGPISDRELGWSAGIIEGEGYMALHKSQHKSKDYIYPRIVVAMTDLDVLERLQRCLGGQICGPYHYKEKNKPHWQWRITTTKHAVGTMMMLYPLMCGRRQERIREMLVAWRDA